MSDSGIAEVLDGRFAWWADGPEDEGAGGGDPLVLVHAGVADARMWEPVLPALARRHRVVRYDMRGFGATRSMPGPFSDVADLRALLDALGIERAHVVGASAGGLHALELAATAPARVASLVLLAAALPDIQPSPRLRAYAEAEEAAIALGHVDRAVEVNVRMWAEHSTPEVQALVTDMQRIAYELQLHEGADPDELDPPVSERLGEIAVPATVAYGDRDVADFVVVAGRLHDELPDATLHVIEGAGHLPALDRPQEVARIVLRHLDRTGSDDQD
jgi:pimeloyl-ACP methyl ester carboxylesterase